MVGAKSPALFHAMTRGNLRLLTQYLGTSGVAIFFALGTIVVVVSGAISGCSSTETPGNDPAVVAANHSMDPNMARDNRVPSVANSELNQQRLKSLWDKRSGTNQQPADFPVGPGDVIQIGVSGVDDLKDRTVRVSGEGQIDLPLVGVVAVGDLTEAGVRDKLKAALTKYMYSPQVDVFVKEYHSRQVAVVGAVRSPGLVMLTGGGESILDVITQAGGMTADAADEIVILPQVSGERSKLAQMAASYEADQAPDASPNAAAASRDMPDSKGTPSSADLAHKAPHTGITLASLEQNITNGPAVVIPLKSGAFQGSLSYTNMPVEPGDIVVVPGGGNVMVTGWVYRPGFFTVGSGLTVLGAVGSAGGAMYASDPTSATLIRSDGSGNKVSIPIDLSKISTGEAPDIPVRANDVVDVPYSNLRIGPYVVYSVLSRMAVPLPAF
jgi:polysaccharide export outer membrane protein